MKKREKEATLSIIYTVLAIFIIVNYILFLLNDRYAERAEKLLIAAFVSLAILVLFTVINVIIFYSQKSKLPENSIFRQLLHEKKARNLKKELIAETKIAIPPIRRMFSRFGMISEQLTLSQQKISITSTNESKILSLESLIYDEKILNERCGICKLTFNHGQIAVFCPQCETLFHKDHLTNWLQTTFHCPICKFIFLNYMLKYPFAYTKKDYK